MDFQSLSRKDLQTLCKKNKIPANITNVAMVEALAALQEVEGIEEFLNPIEFESQQSEKIIDNGSPGNFRTACRTSARRKPVKEEPPTTQSIIRTRRGRAGELTDQENKDLNISLTPSITSNRRRAPVPSARKKLETQLIEGKEEENDQNNGDQKRSDVLETPSMPKTQRKVSALGSTRRKIEARMDKSSVQGACSTRRSMRLLEKNMEKLSLMECGSVEPVVADNPFDELPEKKGFCEQKITEIDPNMNVFGFGGNAVEEDDSKETVGMGIEEDYPEGMNETEDKKEEQASDGKDGKKSKEMVEMEEDDPKETLGLGIDESYDPEGMNETQHKEEQASKEKVEMEDENEDDNTMTDKGAENQSEAAIEEQHDFTPSYNDESLRKESDLASLSPLIQEKDNLDITLLHLEKNAEIITKEKTVELNIEEKAEFLEACCQTTNDENHRKESDLASQSPLIQEKANLDTTLQHEVLEENSEIITEEKTFEFNIEDLIDIVVKEAEFLEACSQTTCNVINAEDSLSEPKVELQVPSDGDYFIKVNIMESELVENSIQETQSIEEHVNNNVNSKDSSPDLQELPNAADQIPVKFLRPTAEESRTSRKIFNPADEDGNANDDEEVIKDLSNKSLRELKKMFKEFHLSKKSNRKKTYGKEQVEKVVVRTALQPSENYMGKDGQEKATTPNSIF